MHPPCALFAVSRNIFFFGYKHNFCPRALVDKRVSTMALITEEAPATTSTEICKICMDAVVNCVLLDCGHMLTCTTCGKQLAECPICRQYIVRVVHVFKS